MISNRLRKTSQCQLLHARTRRRTNLEDESSSSPHECCYLRAGLNEDIPTSGVTFHSPQNPTNAFHHGNVIPLLTAVYPSSVLRCLVCTLGSTYCRLDRIVSASG
jgi:hypothetical protein